MSYLRLALAIMLLQGGLIITFEAMIALDSIWGLLLLGPVFALTFATLGIFD